MDVKLPKAVIVRGNPRWTDHAAESEGFYENLAQLARDQGYEVSFDPGDPYTTPDPTASAWIGHSRGADRLRFAPPGVRTLAIGSTAPGAINNPEDTEMRPGHEPLPAHFSLTDEMRRAIEEVLEKRALGPPPALPRVGVKNDAYTGLRNTLTDLRTFGGPPTQSGVENAARIVRGRLPDEFGQGAMKGQGAVMAYSPREHLNPLSMFADEGVQDRRIADQFEDAGYQATRMQSRPDPNWRGPKAVPMKFRVQHVPHKSFLNEAFGPVGDRSPLPAPLKPVPLGPPSPPTRPRASGGLGSVLPAPTAGLPKLAALMKEAPFKSQKQRAWMYANKPEMAKEWQAHTPKGKKLPKRVKKADALSDIMGQARGMVTRPGGPNRTGEVKPGSMQTLEAPTELGQSLMGLPKPTGPGFKTLLQPTETGRMLTGQKAPEGPVIQQLGGQAPAQSQFLQVVPNGSGTPGSARIAKPSPPPAQNIPTPMPAPTPPSPPQQTAMPGRSWLGGMGQNATNLAMAPFGGGSAGFPSALPPAPAPASAPPGGDDLIDPDKRVTEPMPSASPAAPPTPPPGISGAGMASIYAPPTPPSSPYAPTSATEAFPQQTSAAPSAPLPPSPPPPPVVARPPTRTVPQGIALGNMKPGARSVGSVPQHETAMMAAKQLRDAIRRKNSAATVDSGGYQQEVDAASANLRSITGNGRPNGGRAVMPSTPSERALGRTYAGNAIAPDQAARDANAYRVSPPPGERQGIEYLRRSGSPGIARSDALGAAAVAPRSTTPPAPRASGNMLADMRNRPGLTPPSAVALATNPNNRSTGAATSLIQKQNPSLLAGAKPPAASATGNATALGSAPKPTVAPKTMKASSFPRIKPSFAE